jgi:Protein of unknown function (DUF2961)
MKIMKTGKLWIVFLVCLFSIKANCQTLYQKPAEKTITRWVSPENPTGEKGKGGLTNDGAKGNAFYIIAPGEKKVLLDIKGAGIINRMWLSGTIGTNSEQRRAVRIDMYWDGAKKPAVSAPVGDFFGISHGLIAKYDNELFSSPEARSFNFTIPMPFRKAAYITVTNESSSELWIWYDINLQTMEKVPDDAMYFHAYWNRCPKTKLGEDYVILPKVEGIGRYIGANIGVIGDSLYRGTWFGEGEVKIYLDGDKKTPSLVGTGTEDYIGSGWGQGEYYCRYFGSPVALKELDIYAFYRYHISDPVYFHSDCKVTIQQIGNTSIKHLIEMQKKGAPLIPVWLINKDSKPSKHVRLLGEDKAFKYEDHAANGISFYRSDDVSATAYFYLNQPENNLPELPPLQLRLRDLKDKVWSKIKK